MRKLEAIARGDSDPAERQILDVGCGEALFFDRLEKYGSVSGIEPDRQLVNPQGPHADRIHVGFLDSSFECGRPQDWILMLDVLEHMDDPGDALQQTMRLLRPGGRLIITVPAFNLLWTQHDEHNHHRTRYKRWQLMRLVREQGFLVDSSEYFFYWTFPAKLLVRLKEAVSPGASRPACVPREPFNTAFRLLSLAEQRLLSWLPIPFGSSILLIARRPITDDESERVQQTR